MEIGGSLNFDFAETKTHLALRWLLISAVSALILSSEKLLVAPLMAYAFLFCIFLSNCLLYLIPPRILARSELYLGLGIVDITVATLALVIGGLSDTNFYLMYGLAIIIAALGQDLKRALLSTLLIFFFYYTIIAGHGGRIVVDFNFQMGLLSTLMITALCAHLLQRLRAERLQKQETVGLYQQSKSLGEIQRFLMELHQDITTLDIQHLMQKLAEMVRKHLQVDISDVGLLDGQVIKEIVISGIERKFSEGGKLGSRGKRLQQMVETRKPVVVSDLTQGSPTVKSDATRYPGVRGYLGVPFLSRTGEVIGFLRALTYEPRQFNDREVELLQQIANGAATFLDNTRLIDALTSSNRDLQRTSREQRSLQTLLSDIFLLEVDQLLQKVTEEALLLFEADIASIRVMDAQGRKKAGALAGNPEIVKRIQLDAEKALMGHVKRIMDNKQPLAAKDIGGDAKGRHQDEVKNIDLHGFLGTPLLDRERKPLGVIYLITRRPREFTQREISLIEQFAHCAAIAMENATLVQDLREKTKELQTANARLHHLLEEQSALRDIFRQINLLDSNELLARLANHSLKLLEVDHVQVRLLNQEAVLETVALAGHGAERFRSRALTSGKGRSTWIMKNRRPAMIRDISQDMYFGPGNLMHEMGVKAYLGVPLLSRQQQAIGVLIATKLSESSFTEDAIALAEQLAAGATIAIENARLFEEVQEASKKIQEALQTKSAFMNTMAHELRTPISVILGVHELFEQGIYGEISAEHREAWERVRRNAQGLLDLINDTLDLVRIESGKVPLHPEPLSVAQLANELVTGLLPLAIKKGVDLKFEVDNVDIVMNSDQAKIKTILQNLIGNAIKYTDQGCVYARAYMADAKNPNANVVFSVSDTGIGIKEDQLKHVFEAFFMAEGVDRSKYPGSGFGLTIVQKLAELLGGTVDAKSEVGKGSTFTVTLPISHPEAEILP